MTDLGSNRSPGPLRKQSTDLEPAWANWREVFNMREPCRLGEGLAATGEMKPANLPTPSARSAFRRALAESAGRCIDVLATAAVRDASSALRLIDLIDRAWPRPGFVG